jgi:hypothetical protein
LLPESFSVKVKVLGGGFSVWLGDNIVILSMVKRAHLLFLTGYGPTLSSDSLDSNRWKIDWEDLLSCSCSQFLLQQRNPHPLVEAP